MCRGRSWILWAAERAFSQLKLILEVIGPQPLEDNVETRMLIRVNKKNYQWQTLKKKSSYNRLT